MFDREFKPKEKLRTVSWTAFNAATTTTSVVKMRKTASTSSKGPNPYYSSKLSYVTHLSLREGKPWTRKTNLWERGQRLRRSTFHGDSGRKSGRRPAKKGLFVTSSFLIRGGFRHRADIRPTSSFFFLSLSLFFLPSRKAIVSRGSWDIVEDQMDTVVRYTTLGMKIILTFALNCLNKRVEPKNRGHPWNISDAGNSTRIQQPTGFDACAN